MEKRSIPVCLTAGQYEAVRRHAAARGMLDAGQAVEAMLEESRG